MAAVLPTTANFDAELTRTTSASPEPTKLEGAALTSALQQQLDFYFSKQNLENDAYLLSQMNAARFVPVDIICNFRKVRNLTEDRNVVITVMRSCKNLLLDDTSSMVRPTWKLERTTLILRDIPASTAVSDVQAIFDDAEHKPTSIRSDVGDTWFATFEGEEQCMETALYLSNQSFQGNPVRCRVKPATFLRGSFYNTPAAPVMAAQQWANDGMMQQGYYNPNMVYAGQYGYPYSQGMIMQGAYTGPQGIPQWQQPYSPHSPNGQNMNNQGGERRPRGPRQDRQQTHQHQQHQQQTPGGPVYREKKERIQQGAQGDDRGARAQNPNFKGKGPERNRNGERDQRDNRYPKGKTDDKPFKPQPAPVLPGPMDFPELPPAVRKTRSNNTDAPSMRTYTREEFAHVVNTMGDFPKPNPTAHISSINRTQPLTETQILEPMPVMYPASPSPLLAAQPHHSSDMPSLDLNANVYGNPYLPPDNIQPPADFAAIVNSKPFVPETKKSTTDNKDVIKKPAAAAAAAPPTTAAAPPAVKNLASIVAAAAAKEAAGGPVTPAVAVTVRGAKPATVASPTNTKSATAKKTTDRGDRRPGKEGDRRRDGNRDRGDNRGRSSTSKYSDRERGEGRGRGDGERSKYATKKPSNSRNSKPPAVSTQSSSSSSSKPNEAAPTSPGKMSFADIIRRSQMAKEAAAAKGGAADTASPTAAATDSS